MNKKELIKNLKKEIKTEISKLNNIEITVTSTEQSDCFRVRVDFSNNGIYDYFTDLYFYDDYTEEEFIEQFVRYIKRNVN